jgi:hypothetical protein
MSALANYAAPASRGATHASRPSALPSPAGSAPPRPSLGRPDCPRTAAQSPPPAPPAASPAGPAPRMLQRTAHRSIHSPSRSRIVTASGAFFFPVYFFPIAAATTGSGSGNGTARIDTTHPILRPDERKHDRRGNPGPPGRQDHGTKRLRRELTDSIPAAPAYRIYQHKNGYPA